MPPKPVRIKVARPDRLALAAAAHALAPRASAVLHADGVTLYPRRAGDVRKLFLAEYGSQKRAWKAERAALPLRAEALRRGLERLREAGAPGAESGGLSAEQRAEIARMLAESEAAPKDPLKIARSWSETRRRPA